MQSDQQVAFQNWEDAAEELQKQQQNKTQEPNTKDQNTDEQISDELSQQKKNQKQAPLDPRQVFKTKIAKYSTLTQQQFEALVDEQDFETSQTNRSTGKKIGNPVLKSDKDFNNYARILAQRFQNMVQSDEGSIDDEKLSLFFEQLTLYMYQNIEWKNLHSVQEKLKVLKKQRKTQEQKRRKQKEKQQRLKRLQGQNQSKSQSAHTQQKKQKQEDLFGGVSTINSKQEQEERKNKIITQAPKKEEKQQQQDDDDFM